MQTYVIACADWYWTQPAENDGRLESSDDLIAWDETEEKEKPSKCMGKAKLVWPQVTRPASIIIPSGVALDTSS